MGVSLAHFLTLVQGGGRGGEAPKQSVARSTSTLPHTSAARRGQGHTQNKNLRYLVCTLKQLHKQ
ncbi:MAG: hypothetical protein NZ455_15090 [Bacteroidia bacterium]|nr:hypothetical protein [Bacteroidia bacterium]MDW8345552.1 hypothetical protein [Bacteroidia bacterium]